MNDLSATSVLVPNAYETSLGLRGRLTETHWELPDDLSEEEWILAGLTLGKIERSVSWWIGDWWAFGEHRYGNRKAIVESDNWGGPSFHTCVHAGTVCRAFETRRRRRVLSFRHHQEAVSLPPTDADVLLDWAEEPIARTGKARSTRELRGEVNRRRVTVGAQPSDQTCTVTDLYTLAESGHRFGSIYADPPWLYDNQGTRAATSNHYGGMTVDQLCELPVRQLAADDAHLHLWTTNAFLFDAPRIFEAWGFEFRSALIWCKPQMGIGNYYRNAHEYLLVAVRGDAKRFNDHAISSWFVCDRGKHSVKPEQARAIIERASPGPYLEMFGRRAARGWTVWGNQIDKQDLFSNGVAA